MKKVLKNPPDMLPRPGTDFAKDRRPLERGQLLPPLPCQLSFVVPVYFVPSLARIVSLRPRETVCGLGSARVNYGEEETNQTEQRFLRCQQVVRCPPPEERVVDALPASDVVDQDDAVDAT